MGLAGDERHKTVLFCSTRDLNVLNQWYNFVNNDQNQD
jgi:hypothetical protein